MLSRTSDCWSTTVARSMKVCCSSRSPLSISWTALWRSSISFRVSWICPLPRSKMAFWKMVSLSPVSIISVTSSSVGASPFALLQNGFLENGLTLSRFYHFGDFVVSGGLARHGFVPADDDLLVVLLHREAQAGELGHDLLELLSLGVEDGGPHPKLVGAERAQLGFSRVLDLPKAVQNGFRGPGSALDVTRHGLPHVLEDCEA